VFGHHLRSAPENQRTVDGYRRVRHRRAQEVGAAAAAEAAAAQQHYRRPLLHRHRVWV